MILFTFTLVLLPSCGSWRRVSDENDRLRRESLELHKLVQDLETRAQAAEKRLEIEVKGHRATPGLPEGVHKPAVSRIEIASPSRGADTDKDSGDDAVRLYLDTYDQRGRFFLTVARVSVTVAAVPAGQQAVTLATKEFDAKAFDEAYHSSGLGGTHYTLLVPLTSPVPDGTEKLTVTVKLSDLLTSAEHTAEKIVNFTAK